MRNFIKSSWLILLLLQISCSPSKDKDLNANVGKASFSISIKNNDDFAYRNCKLTLNDKYILTGIEITAGESRNIELKEFTDDSGVRFDIAQKVMSLEIWCEIPDGGHGFYLGDWK